MCSWQLAHSLGARSGPLTGVLLGGSLAQTEFGCGLVGQADVLWEAQNGAKALVGDKLVNDLRLLRK